MRETLQHTSSWLQDLVRQGLAREEVGRAGYWHQQAARLVDAKCTGLARRSRRISTWPSTDPAWAPMLLAELGRLHLLLGAALQYEALEPPIQRELDLLLKPPPRRELLLEHSEAVPDLWRVLGVRRVNEASGPQQLLRVVETWLAGETSGRLALYLSFAPVDGKTPAPQPLGAIGACGQPGEGAYFLSPGQFRVFFRDRSPEFDQTAPAALDHSHLPWLGAFAQVDVALEAQLAHAPWLEQFPFVISDLSPLTDAQANAAGCLAGNAPFPARRWVADGVGVCRPVSPLFPDAYWWQWLAQTREHGPCGAFALLDPAPYVFPITLFPQSGAERCFGQ